MKKCTQYFDYYSLLLTFSFICFVVFDLFICFRSSPYIDSSKSLTNVFSLKTPTSDLIPRKASLTVDNRAFLRSKKVFKSDNLVRSLTTTNATTLPSAVNQTNAFSVDVPFLSRSENCVIDSVAAASASAAAAADVVNLDKKSFNYLRDSKVVKSEENILTFTKGISLSENSLNAASKCSSTKDIYSSHDSDSVDFLKSGENVSQFEYSSKSESDISNHRVSLPEDELLRVQ